MEVKSGRNKRAKSLRTMMQEKDRNRVGYKVMDSNIGTDENGVTHLPLYAPCFFEGCQIKSLPLPSSSEEVNKAFLERENDVQRRREHASIGSITGYQSEVRRYAANALRSSL